MANPAELGADRPAEWQVVLPAGVVVFVAGIIASAVIGLQISDCHHNHQRRRNQVIPVQLPLTVLPQPDQSPPANGQIYLTPHIVESTSSGRGIRFVPSGPGEWYDAEEH
jgi:hypothetical protein